MPNSLSRFEIFQQASQKLRADFNSLSVIPHRALKGQEAEKIVRQFLSNHLPRRFDVGSGFIVDPNDAVSPQTDVIVYDAHNCPAYRMSEDAAIFPADNVPAIIEVKSILDKRAIEDAWNKIGLVKSMARSASPETPWLQTVNTMGILFAFESDLKFTTIAQHYRDLFHSHGIGQHIDMIVILDKGLVMLSGNAKGLGGWVPIIIEGFGSDSSEGLHLATTISEFGTATLDAFLRLLLTKLIHFRPITFHPGYNWSAFPGDNRQVLQYLTTITNETDPEKEEEKLRAYKEEADLLFEQMIAENGPVPE